MSDMWNEPYEIQNCPFFFLFLLLFHKIFIHICSNFPYNWVFSLYLFSKKYENFLSLVYSVIQSCPTLCDPSEFCHFRSRNNLRWSQKHRGFASGYKTFLVSHILLLYILHGRCSRFPMVNRLVWKVLILIFWIWRQSIRGNEVVSRWAILKYPLINVVFLASNLVDHFPTQHPF